MKKMERPKYTPFPSPPSRACSVCVNKFSEVCHTKCAPAEDYRFFEPDFEKPHFLLPKLSFDEFCQLPTEVQTLWNFYRLEKLEEVINGEPRVPDRNRGVKVTANFPRADVYSRSETGDPIRKGDGKANYNSQKGVGEMDTVTNGTEVDPDVEAVKRIIQLPEKTIVWLRDEKHVPLGADEFAEWFSKDGNAEFILELKKKHYEYLVAQEEARQKRLKEIRKKHNI